MKIGTIATAGMIALGLTGCNRGGDGNATGTANIAAANSQAAGLPVPPSRPKAGTAPPALQVDAQGVVNNCISPADQQRPIAEFDANQRRDIVSCLNAAAAQQLNQRLPLQIDEVTRLDRIATAGPLLTYHYSVSRRLAQLPAGIGEQLGVQARSTVCGRQDMRQTLELGGAYAYRWVDADGEVINEVRIDAC